MTARGSVEAERREHEAKTVRLKAARFAKEAADLLAHAPGKPSARGRKAPS